MRKLVLGLAVEILMAMLLAGLILALAIPLLDRGGLIAIGDVTSRNITVGVMLGALAIALFRPGSAIHRHRRR